MTTMSAKSTSGRTEWVLDNGLLKEIGPSSPLFTLSAEDTFILMKLLFAGKNEIVAAVGRERKLSQQDMISAGVKDDGMISDSGPRIGATSSITIADELKHKDPNMIGKTRGA
jgi:hypothetical protein